jgi:hypothetical protein
MDDASPPGTNEPPRAQGKGQGKGLRFIDAMPRPLLGVFIATGVVAVVAALVFIIHPPEFATVPVQERRPPPKGVLSHDTGRIMPAPVPSVLPSLVPACSAVGSTILEVGNAGAVRLHAMLADVCTLASGGVAPELTTAIRGFEGATIRFAAFGRAGVESTADFATKTIWLNIKFSRSSQDVEQVVPVLIHDAWHLARPANPVTAIEELGARRAEVEACRQLIPIDTWPRWCDDARALTDLSPESAVALLVSAGYRPGYRR